MVQTMTMDWNVWHRLYSHIRTHFNFRTEKYVFREVEDDIDHDVAIIQYLKDNYRGEVLMIPGDTNAGFWDKDSFVEQMRLFLGDESLSRQQTVLEAGDRCYSGLLSSFRYGGYSNVLVAIGDHELGTYPPSL